MIDLGTLRPVSALASRERFQDRAKQVSALGERCAALCLDLEHFKAVSDTFGRPVGDMLLRAVSDRLLGCVRHADVLSRLGGERFAVLLVGLPDPEHAGIVAQRMLRAMRDPFDLDGRIVSVEATIGIAVAPADGGAPDSLLDNAAAAAACAKRDDPGGLAFFVPGMETRSQARAALEADLREALRTEAFALAYQPQFEVADNRLIGFEALIRWRHPVRGMVGPNEFIPVAEQTGLIVPIGAWVLRQACAEAMRWPDRLTVSVNMSAVQLKDPAIAETVRAALSASGLPAARLDLEVTETARLIDDSRTLAVLHALHQLGVSLAMDDFGTGYSSLSYLRSFPFDRIKIDQSFVRDLSQRNDARAIVRSVLALGRDLGIKILAEGVETPEQLAFLRQEGCHEVQGYLFSKPVDAAAARLLALQGKVAVPVPPAAGTEAPPLVTVPLRVLLVDDVLMNRDIAGSILRAAGHKVVLAEGGAEAVAAARDADFDVILMDVRMPDMDGLEATRQVRAIRGVRGRVPIVAVTARAFPEQVTECRLAGMTGHLAKPYTREALLMAVASLGAAAQAAGSPADMTGPPAPVLSVERASGPDGPAPATDVPVVDQAAFERTISFLQPATAALHLRIIDDHAVVLLDRLRGEGTAGGARQDLTEAAHMLAGSAGLFGFARLASVAREFRRAGRMPSPAAPEIAGKLAAALEISLLEIRRRM